MKLCIIRFSRQPFYGLVVVLTVESALPALWQEHGCPPNRASSQQQEATSHQCLETEGAGRNDLAPQTVQKAAQSSVEGSPPLLCLHLRCIVMPVALSPTRMPVRERICDACTDHRRTHPKTAWESHTLLAWIQRRMPKKARSQWKSPTRREFNKTAERSTSTFGVWVGAERISKVMWHGSLEAARESIARAQTQVVVEIGR